METKKVLSMVAVGLIFVGCAGPNSNPVTSAPSESSSSEAEVPSGSVADYPLLWEASRKDSLPWTSHTFAIVEQEANTFLRGTEDVESFCPRYNTLTNRQRVNFWGVLISAVAKYESGFSPVSRMLETTLGKDSVTGLPVYSEGLLQLSYQDIKWASYCEFDWTTDRRLPANDPQKTILDPYKNLTCGIKILAKQIAKRGVIAAKSGQNYWSTLIPGGKYTKLSQIQALTKKMTGCQ